MSSVAAVEITDIDEVVFEDDVDIQEAKKPEGFVIDNQEKATWAAHRLLRAEDRMKERGHLAKDYKAKIDTWLETANRSDETTVETMRTLLTPFLESELSGKKRKRSVDLLGARIGFRKLPERVEVIDEEAAITFCESKHPEVVVVKKELSRSELRKVAQKGELVPGVVLDGGDDRLYVKATDTE
tara:strand:+ start:1600 stop:2154 length:555 start_codon:yes stop_codon:yes gene_type:complete